MSAPTPSRSWAPGAVVALVLVVGVVAGVVLDVTAPQVLPPGPCPPPPGGCPAPPSPSAVLSYPHVTGVLVAVALVALLALLVVYGRTYWETRAPQMLGLALFLGALLLETILTSPFVFARFGGLPRGVEPFLVAGQVFEALALLIFLYVSVQ